MIILILITTLIFGMKLVESSEEEYGQPSTTPPTTDDKTTYNPDNPNAYEGWDTGNIPADANSQHVADNYNRIPENKRGNIKSDQMTKLKDSQLDFKNMNPSELQQHLKTKYPDSDIIPSDGMSMTDDGKLNYGDSNVDVNSLPEGSTIDIKDGELHVNGNQYKNAQNIHGNPDGSVSTDSADFIQS